MVREFHQNRDQDLLLAVDLWLPQHPEPADLDRLEAAISFAATICVELCGQAGESQLWLGSAGQEFTKWSGSAGALALDSVLELLAVAEGKETSELPRLLDRLGQSTENPSRRILITTRRVDDAKITEALKRDSQSHLADVQVFGCDPSSLREFFEHDPELR